jgi:hypothetical protein
LPDFLKDMETQPKTQRFTTTVSASGSRIFILIPFSPNDVWGKKQRHHILGTVNGFPIRGSLGSDGGQYFIVLGAAWRRGCGIGAGTPVDVLISPEGPQSDALPSDVAQALDSEPKAREFFESLATFYRNNYIRWIESAKRPETRAKRINEMVALLRAGKKQK